MGCAAPLPRSDDDGLEATRLVSPGRLAGQVFDRNGNGGPTVWADGRIIGAWAQREDGSITTLTSPLTATRRKLLDAEIDRVRALVGETRFHDRFPSPLSRTLSGQ